MTFEEEFAAMASKNAFMAQEIKGMFAASAAAFATASTRIEDSGRSTVEEMRARNTRFLEEQEAKNKAWFESQDAKNKAWADASYAKNVASMIGTRPLNAREQFFHDQQIMNQSM